MPAPYSRWRPEVQAVETRKTFVLWIARKPGETAAPAVLSGRLEEVDTGIQLRFGSAEQLVAFLTESVRKDREGSDE
jgi:hypothetical protein